LPIPSGGLNVLRWGRMGRFSPAPTGLGAVSWGANDGMLLWWAGVPATVCLGEGGQGAHLQTAWCASGRQWTFNPRAGEIGGGKKKSPLGIGQTGSFGLPPPQTTQLWGRENAGPNA